MLYNKQKEDCPQNQKWGDENNISQLEPMS